MRLLVHSVCVLFLLGGCKGEPIGARVPRPNKKAAAGIAAAVAGAMTIANPKLAGRQPETAKSKRPRPMRVKQNVTPGVLDRLDEQKKHPSARPPCPPPNTKSTKKTKPADGSKLAIVPKPKTGKTNGVHVRRPCEPPATKKKARTQ